MLGTVQIVNGQLPLPMSTREEAWRDADSQAAVCDCVTKDLPEMLYVITNSARDLLERALRTSGGSNKTAAAALGMNASTFRDKLAKHGLG